MDKIHKVVWEINTFGASNYVEAAREALQSIRDPDTLALIFDVYELDTNGHEISHKQIDLLEEE